MARRQSGRADRQDWGKSLKFLGRAKKLLRVISEPSKPRVQRFSVRCPSGHWIRGERTLGYQALRCPGCGEGVFVLPVSPLPEPSVPERPRMERRSASGATSTDEGPVDLVDLPGAVEFSEEPADRTSDAEIIWDDTVAEAVQEVKTRERKDRPKPDAVIDPRSKAGNSRAEPRPQELNASKGRRAQAARREVGGPPDFGAFDQKESQRPRRIPPRPVLVFLGVAFLVLGTFGVRVWRNQRKELPGIFDLGRTEGLAALEAGQFDKAHQLLSAAKRAVDALGGGLEGADEVRHGADEAAIFVDLVSESLEDLLNEAGPMEPEEWKNRFKALYAGHSILIDAAIIRTPTPDEPTAYELDYVILPPGDPSQFNGTTASKPSRQGIISLSDFELIQLAKPKVGDHVVFGAKLASFTFDPNLNCWFLRFVPKSGVFITHSRALESLGWPAESFPSEKPAEEGP
ncbi:MAG: hypothetical protein ABS79_04595 [Planctomycetes bacterium SCN 63-9]|nr:MAG: hypothetical protein ABS79_04595 [Planctomycetes bacterium SCN 63-9]